MSSSLTFCCTKVTDDPDKIDFAQAGSFLLAELVHLVPDGLENRRKGRDAYPGYSSARELEDLMVWLTHLQLATPFRSWQNPPTPTQKVWVSACDFQKGKAHPSIMTRGITCFISQDASTRRHRHTLPTGGEMTDPSALSPFSLPPRRLAPNAAAKGLVQSPTHRICTEI